MNDIKHTVLEEIQKSVPVFKPASRFEYRVNCPLCGDTKLHCYLRCSDDPTEPMLWNCFKCNSSGIVNPWFLRQLGVSQEICDLLKTNKLNKISQYASTDKPIEILTGEYIPDSVQVRYIEFRLGKGFTKDDYDKFKIVWDINPIYDIVTSNRVRNIIPNNMNSISFLSDDKTMLVNRTFEEGHHWRKIKIINSNNKSFYTIKTNVDLFAATGITVNIAEGVFDILSAYKNFNTGDNSVYIAVLGSDYLSGLEYVISKGIVGSNVNVNVYMDSDQDVKFFINEFKRYKWIFNNIIVYWNVTYKDIGVTKENIKLVERRV